MATYAPFWKALAFQRQRGEPITDVIKSWQYSGGATTWELRRLVHALGYGGKCARCCRFVEHLEKTLQRRPSRLPFFDDIVESRHAKRAKRMPAEEVNDDAIREEYQIGTHPLLRMLVYLVGVRRGEQMCLTEDVFRAFFAALVLEQYEGALMAELALTEEEGQMCDSWLDGCAHCAHSHLASETAGRRSHGRGWKVFVAIFCLVLASEKTNCQACLRFLDRLLKAVAQVIDRGLNASGAFSDPLMLTSHMDTNNRRRRYDEDFKAAVTTRVVMEGKAGSVREYAKAQSAGGALKAKTAGKWDHDHLQWHHACMWQLATGFEEVSITVDGSRIGQPAKGTFMYAMYNVEHEVGGWLMPQALFLCEWGAWQSYGARNFGVGVRSLGARLAPAPALGAPPRRKFPC